MILEPIGDNLILKIEMKQKEEKTNAGLILINEGTEQSLRTDMATVIAIGEGRVLNNGQPMYFNIGLMGASQNKLINQIEINPDKKLVEKNIGQILKPTVKEGDKVLYNKFAGTEINADGEKYLILKETDILAIVK